MTIESLKPVLFVVAIGLLGIAALLSLGADDLASALFIPGQFSRLVAACQDEHPDWEGTICPRIVRGEVWIGMTQNMLITSLGEPRSIDQPRKDDPTYEEWTYRTARYGEEIFRIENGIVIGDIPVVGCATCGIQEDRVIGR